MALNPNKTAMAVKMQSAEGTFDAPSSTTDVTPIAGLQLALNGVTIQNDEYTGSIHRNGDDVAGKNFSGSFNVKLRPPGGADVPSADAFIPGRFLKAAKYTELRTTAAIPAAPEAVSAGTTSAATLGAGAAATADLYKGLAILLAGQGAAYKDQLTAIRAYTAGKEATFAEEFAGNVSGNYQIPKQLSYVRSITEDEAPFLSVSLWLDGYRTDIVDFRVSSLRIVLPVSTRDQAAYPMLEIGFTGTIEATADEATPNVPALGAVPLWKDGKFSVANKKVGGSNFSLDLGLRQAYPPNPNEADGSEGGQLIESQSTASMDIHAYRKADFDTLALADAQAYHAALCQWGYSAGKAVQLVIPDFRFNYQTKNLGGDFITESGDLFIDVMDRNSVINFPY